MPSLRRVLATWVSLTSNRACATFWPGLRRSGLLTHLRERREPAGISFSFSITVSRVGSVRLVRMGKNGITMGKVCSFITASMPRSFENDVLTGSERSQLAAWADESSSSRLPLLRHTTDLTLT